MKVVPFVVLPLNREQYMICFCVVVHVHVHGKCSFKILCKYDPIFRVYSSHISEK